MYEYRICDFQEPDWEPLERTCELTRLTDDLITIHPSDFMYVARIVTIEPLGLPDVHLYKHVDTRCYLNLDELGRAYRGTSRKPSSRKGRKTWAGWYRPLPDLATAIAYLDLWSRDPSHPFHVA